MAPITTVETVSPAILFTVVALVFAVYYFIFKLFRSSSKLRDEVTEKEQEQNQNDNGDDILTAIETSEIVEIPEDLITEILQLLPVKTLVRLRRVSKSLRGIIDSPDFSRWHLTKTTSHNTTRPKIILVQQSPHFHTFPPVPVRVFDLDDFFLVDGGDPTDLGFGEYSFNRTSFPTFAHCNGLVVLEEHPFSLVLWNPTIRKCRKLPVLPNEDPLDRLQPGIIALGFGYDSSFDDYKVLVIKERRFWVDSDVETKHECWVFGFRLGHWRRIELPDNLRYYTNFFLDGALLFLSCGTDVMFAFDLAKETFSRVSLDDFFELSFSDFGQTQERPIKFQVFQGCLCVKFSSREQHDEFYARKKNDEGEFCWIKLFQITYEQLSDLEFYIFRIGVILGYSKDGDKVFVISCDRYALYSYDFQEKSIKRIVTGHGQKVFSYIESLVWIDVQDNEKRK